MEYVVRVLIRVSATLTVADLKVKPAAGVASSERQTSKKGNVVGVSYNLPWMRINYNFCLYI